jgi:hypothetical protein
MNLCDEYKEQSSKIKKLIDIKFQLNKSLPEKDLVLTKEISDLNYYKNNLEFAIKWMTKCHEPGVYEGIDNLKALKSYQEI